MSYRLRPGHTLEHEVRRIAGDQLDKAIRQLECQPDVADAVFSARKRIKKVRGLYRLVHSGQPAFFRRENRRLRDVGRALSALRDAAAMVDTLERLWQHAERSSASMSTIRRFFTAHAMLIARRDAIAADLEHRNDSVVQAVAACRDARKALRDLTLPRKTRRCADIAGVGYDRTWAHACKLLDAASHTGRAHSFHEARKWMKYHRMHCSLLRDCWPSMFLLRVDVARQLSLRLGEDHDLAVLIGYLAAAPSQPLPEQVQEPAQDRLDAENLPLTTLANSVSLQLRAEAIELAEPLLRDGTLAGRAVVARLYRLSRSSVPRS